MKLIRKISVIICCILFAMSSLLLGLDMFGLIKRTSTNAITNIDTLSFVKVDEIWNGSAFDGLNFNQLLRMVANNSSVSSTNMSMINSLASSKRTAEAMRSGTTGKTSGKDIVVRFAGLDWEVVYLSTDKSGNPILTLWLTNNYQKAWAGRNDSLGQYHGFYNGGLYSDFSANWSSTSVSGLYPSNMYGRSYVKMVTLNNANSMWFYYSTGTSSASASQTSSSPFAKFTMSRVAENVTQYIVTPEQVSWQESGQNSKGTGTNYNCSNENWSTGVSDDGFYSSLYNYAHKSNNDIWKYDKLWLPSLYEIGYGGQSNGLWKANKNQRANFNGSTSSISAKVGTSNTDNILYNSSMIRSASNTDFISTRNLSVKGDYVSPLTVSSSAAVRPALHLNLKEAAANTINLVNKNAAKVDEIWTGSEIKTTNANRLLQMVTDNSSSSTTNLTTLVAQATSIRTSADMRTGTTLKSSGQDIIVRFGGLDWQVMYLSTDKLGQPILTLWLDNNYQEAWLGRNDSLRQYHGFYNGGLYSDWSANWLSSDATLSGPSNMYGKSYVRYVTLNSQNGYYTSDGTNATSGGNKISSPFAIFTNDSVAGNVTKYIVTPEQVSWQESGQNSKGTGTNYNCSNENWSTGVSDDGFYSSLYNYAHKSNNDIWKYDKLWLPSLYEIGYGGQSNGLWKANKNQRANFNGSTSSISAKVGTSNTDNILYNSSMIRSASNTDFISTRNLSVKGDYVSSLTVSSSAAVRPALHLNLYMLAGLKYDFEFNYNGGEGPLGQQNGIEVGSIFEFPVATRTGYTLVGWEHNGTTYVATNGKLSMTVSYLGDDSSKKVFSAIWTPNTYKVTLDNQSATTAGTTSVDIAYDAMPPNITPPTRRGYTFRGYFTQTNGNGKQYYNGKEARENIAKGAQVWKETTVTILYAKWEANKYKINFDNNGGNGGSMSEIEYTFPNSVTLPSCTFIRPGKIFMYWTDNKNGYTYKDGGTVPSSRYAEDIILTAQWQTTWADYASISLAGEGTESNPYIIATAGDLAFLSLKVQEENVNGHYTNAFYKQTAHINLSAHYWLPIGGNTIETNPEGDRQKAFRGVYDGQRYSISGIKFYSQINASGRQLFNNVGLFGYTVGATIKNVNLSTGSVTGYKRIGGLVGFASTGLIENCVSYVNVIGDQSCGMIGQGDGVTVNKCYNHGNITGRENVGGIIGGADDVASTITDCISQCNIVGNNGADGTLIAGIMGYSSLASSIKNSAFIGSITNGKILLGSGSTTTITDCYAECNSDISLYNSVSKVISTIYIAGGNKYYYEGGADFSNWTMYNGKPLPNGLTWIGGLILDNEPFTLGSDYNKRD